MPALQGGRATLPRRCCLPLVVQKRAMPSSKGSPGLPPLMSCSASPLTPKQVVKQAVQRAMEASGPNPGLAQNLVTLIVCLASSGEISSGQVWAGLGVGGRGGCSPGRLQLCVSVCVLLCVCSCVCVCVCVGQPPSGAGLVVHPPPSQLLPHHAFCNAHCTHAQVIKGLSRVNAQLADLCLDVPAARGQHSKVMEVSRGLAQNRGARVLAGLEAHADLDSNHEPHAQRRLWT